jgi:hypothetical protein
MNARALSDERLEYVIENAREFLASGEAQHPETVRSVLRQAEEALERREHEGRA